MLALGASLIGGVLIASLGVTDAKAVDFKDKRIQIIVPFNEGGGTDSLTRFMQPFLEKYLPGNPTILVLNKPGAGGIVGGNYFESKAKNDGTWVMALSTSTIFNYVLGDPRVKFDVTGWVPILLAPRGNMIYTREELGVHKIKGLKAKVEHLKSIPIEKLVFGGKTPTSSAINKRIALTSLGINVKNVWGMKGNGPMALAFERGEFTINFDNSLSYLNNRKALIDKGIAQPLFTLGAPNEKGEWGRDPVHPDTPTIYEFYEAVHGKKVSGGMGAALDSLVQLGVGANKSFHLPNGTPKDVVEAWRDASRKMFKDPEFLKRKDKILGPYAATIGAPAKRIIHDKLQLPKEAKAWLKDFAKKRYNIALDI
jgi:tripartite-type tricarboxylate transporter receptor subunit TctC